jgi:hypothetical protein
MKLAARTCSPPYGAKSPHGTKNHSLNIEMQPKSPPYPPAINAERQRIHGARVGATAWAIFHELWERQGHPVRYTDLWQYIEGDSPNRLRMHICILRKRLAGTGYEIETVPNVGYELHQQ